MCNCEYISCNLSWRSHRSHSSSHISHEDKQPAGRSRDQKYGHRHVDHNMEGISLHVLADTMGSVGVVISTLLIKYKGRLIADPASSIFISIMIISSVFPLLRNSAEILLQRLPQTHEQEMFETLDEEVRMKGVTRGSRGDDARPCRHGTRQCFYEGQGLLPAP
ncbi:hypothetical protein MLD38_005096 [Melastoma candidum]|uniref:Uncharacterized protein n=1 Tax=Melastoma candidum TaxID=119954 RepID=A0ACB9S9P7_9MYRT|nr:hypothetical protein MLD38_005096 [Melastoma candidum]